MTPTINVGDLAIIKIDKHPTLKNGDIIFFRSGNSYAVHRVFNIDQDKITTKGDSNNGPDPEIIKNVNGVFLFKIPLIGYPINILQIVLTYPIRLIRGG
jgi:signal peptidase I